MSMLKYCAPPTTYVYILYTTYVHNMHVPELMFNYVFTKNQLCLFLNYVNSTFPVISRLIV